MIKLSIITINYNNDVGLQKTIESVVSQSFVGFEYIVIDGGSTDLSVEIIKKYSAKINYWVSEKDNGIYNAMNKGIKVANGQYCLFLNSGDMLYNNTVLEDAFSLASQTDIIYGNLLFTYPNGAKRKGVMPSKLTFRHMMHDTLWHPVSFIKTKLFTSIGLFDEQYSIVADYDFFVRALLIHKVTTRKVNKIIAIFSQDGVSAEPSNLKKINEQRRSIQLRYFSKHDVDDALKINAVEKLWKRVKRRIGI